MELVVDSHICINMYQLLILLSNILNLYCLQIVMWLTPHPLPQYLLDHYLLILLTISWHHYYLILHLLLLQSYVNKYWMHNTLYQSTIHIVAILVTDCLACCSRFTMLKGVISSELLQNSENTSTFMTNYIKWICYWFVWGLYFFATKPCQLYYTLSSNKNSMVQIYYDITHV